MCLIIGCEFRGGFVLVRGVWVVGVLVVMILVSLRFLCVVLYCDWVI